MPIPSRRTAHIAYDLLVQLGDARESEREEFVNYITDWGLGRSRHEWGFGHPDCRFGNDVSFFVTRNGAMYVSYANGFSYEDDEDLDRLNNFLVDLCDIVFMYRS